MLARIREMEVLVRWASLHWEELREALGFDRGQPPVAITISRTLAQCTVADVQAVFMAWLPTCGAELPSESVAAVDGKTAKQAIDSDGRPLHMLSVFVHIMSRLSWGNGRSARRKRMSPWFCDDGWKN